VFLFDKWGSKGGKVQLRKMSSLLRMFQTRGKKKNYIHRRCKIILHMRFIIYQHIIYGF
jgi:hypothetical protein